MKSTIKYDLKLVNTLRNTTLIITLPVLFSVVCMFMTNEYRQLDGLISIGMLCFWPMVGMWLVYIDGRVFLKSLEKAGYEIPYDRREYDGKIENLPRTREIEIHDTGVCRQSQRLSAMAAIVVLLLGIVDIKYLWQWYIVDDSTFMLGCMGVLLIMWAIGSYVYYRQSDNTVFRELFEPDDGRKVRTSFGKGVFTIIICGIISIFLMSLPFSVTRYFAKSRLLVDRDNILRFVDTLEAVCENEKLSEDSDFYRQLTQGMDPFNDKWSDEEILCQTLEEMGCQYLDEIDDKLKMKNHKVYITLEEGQIKTTYSYTWEYGKTATAIYN